MKILVAGASGVVGREVLQLLTGAGHQVRALSRSEANAAPVRALAADVRLGDATRPETLTGLCDGCDVVFSALGGSVAMKHPDRRSYLAVDLEANRSLLAEARRAQAERPPRFVYVSLHTEPGYADTAYVRAHEAFVDELRRSGLPYAVVRPTGIFSALADLVEMARRGAVPVVGSGAARSNPVHERDVAEACVEAILSPDPALEIEVGGPQILTRRQMAELAFQAIERRPRVLPVPALLMRLAAALVGLFDRRRGELFAFVARVSTTDCVAPQRGRRRLGEFFEGLARGRR